MTAVSGGGRSGAGLFAGRVAQVDQPDEALVTGHADGVEARALAQDLWGPPVAGEAAGVGSEQDDVRGDAGGVQVLLVLHVLAGQGARADDQRGRAVELRRRLGPGGVLQPLERLRPDHPEAPGNREVVVGRPSRELEELVQHLARNRLGPVRLVRAPGPNRLVNVHALTVAARRIPPLEHLSALWPR